MVPILGILNLEDDKNHEAYQYNIYCHESTELVSVFSDLNATVISLQNWYQSFRFKCYIIYWSSVYRTGIGLSNLNATLFIGHQSTELESVLSYILLHTQQQNPQFILQLPIYCDWFNQSSAYRYCRYVFGFITNSFIDCHSFSCPISNYQLSVSLFTNYSLFTFTMSSKL